MDREKRRGEEGKKRGGIDEYLNIINVCYLRRERLISFSWYLSPVEKGFFFFFFLETRLISRKEN